MVSVVIPVYNVEQYIEKSLLSAINQTYGEIEILLIDDRGSDNSMAIVESILKDYPTKNIKIVRHEKNRGLSAARNTGISYSTGKYVYFMDSDDIISPNCIECLVNVANKYNADFVDGNVRVIGGKSTLFTPYEGIKYIHNSLPEMFFRGALHPSAWNKLLSRQFLITQDIKFVEGLIYEDVLFVLELCKHANIICTIDSYTYDYIIRSGSITTTINENNIRHQYDSIIYILSQIYNYADTLSLSTMRDAAYVWALKYSFKAACRLSAMDVKPELISLYYKQLTIMNKKNKRFNLLSLVMTLPFGVFKSLFYLPYKYYKLS